MGALFAIVGGLILSKIVAAMVAQKLFGYSRTEGLLMGALSLPKSPRHSPLRWSRLRRRTRTKTV